MGVVVEVEGRERTRMKPREGLLRRRLVRERLLRRREPVMQVLFHHQLAPLGSVLVQPLTGTQT